MKVLIPVDCSSNSQHAVRHVVREYRSNLAMEIQSAERPAAVFKVRRSFRRQHGDGRDAQRGIGEGVAADHAHARRGRRAMRGSHRGRRKRRG